MHKTKAILIAYLFASAACASPETCDNLISQSRDALKRQDFKASATQLKAMENACPEEILGHEQKVYTDALAKQANTLINQDRLAEAEALISQAQAVSWSVHSIKGHLAAKRKDWKEAAHQYHLAYDLLDESSQTSQGQDVAELKRRHHQWAGEAQLLGGTVDVVTSRDGEDKILLGTRDIGIEESFPVKFPFDSAEPTAEGLDSIDKLAIQLGATKAGSVQSRGFYADLPAVKADKKKKPVAIEKNTAKPILVVGHTDDRGSEQYNLDLSLRRAEAVVKYLKLKGVSKPLKAVGKGKSAPLELSDPKRYTDQEEIWALNRRVEIIE